MHRIFGSKWNINFEIINFNVSRHRYHKIFISYMCLIFIFTFAAFILVLINAKRCCRIRAYGLNTHMKKNIDVALYFIDMHVAILMVSMCIVCSYLYLFITIRVKRKTKRASFHPHVLSLSFSRPLVLHVRADDGG